MKRAISIAALVAFAAGCFAVANFYFNPQPVSATKFVMGQAHYQMPCGWQQHIDETWLWDWEKTEHVGHDYIGAPPSYNYKMEGDWNNGWYWVEGITYYYHWDDWRPIHIQGDVTEQDVWFCFSETPNGGGN